MLQYKRNVKSKDPSFYGLRETCILNELKHLHNHVFDIMHDLLEGKKFLNIPKNIFISQFKIL